MASGVLRVDVLTEGVHSGDASGVVPSSFRVLRQVLDRLEDSATGRLLPGIFHCDVPPERLAQARATAKLAEQVTAMQTNLAKINGVSRDVETLLKQSFLKHLSND
jgi:hypothetical protein